MIQHNTEEMTALVHNRLFKGGRVGILWHVFRSNHLSGIFLISGNRQTCNLELVRGAIVNFTFKDQQEKWDKNQSLARLRHLVRKSDVRFSIYVTR